MKLPIKNYHYSPRGFRFGEIYPNNWGDLSGKPHLGEDLICPTGTELYAPLAGEIIMTGETAVSGKFIHLKCGNLIFRFLHLSEILERGQVREGEIIGLTGNTGMSSAPHCHLDISRNAVDIYNFSNFIDPENWVKINQTMQKIKIQESINIDVGLKYKVIDFFLKNGFEIEFGTYTEYFAYLVQGSLNTNPYARKANGGCDETATPYKITFAADPDDIEYSAMILEHEILHGMFRTNGLKNIHDIERELQKSGVVNWQMGQMNNQNAIDYLNKNKSDNSRDKNNMLKIKDLGKEQYLIGADGKAYHIYNAATLQALEVAGIVEVGVPKNNLETANADSGKEIIILDKE